MYTNRELCEKCADEPGTINNMQELIIPLLNDDIEEFKDILFHLYHHNRNHRLKGSPDATMVLCKDVIVGHIKAIQKFYKRFPELQRVRATKRYYPRGRKCLDTLYMKGYISL